MWALPVKVVSDPTPRQIYPGEIELIKQQNELRVKHTPQNGFPRWTQKLPEVLRTDAMVTPHELEIRERRRKVGLAKKNIDLGVEPASEVSSWLNKAKTDLAIPALDKPTSLGDLPSHSVFASKTNNRALQHGFSAADTQAYLHFRNGLMHAIERYIKFVKQVKISLFHPHGKVGKGQAKLLRTKITEIDRSNHTGAHKLQQLKSLVMRWRSEAKGNAHKNSLKNYIAEFDVSLSDAKKQNISCELKM